MRVSRQLGKIEGGRVFKDLLPLLRIFSIAQEQFRENEWRGVLFRVASSWIAETPHCYFEPPAVGLLGLRIFELPAVGLPELRSAESEGRRGEGEPP